MRTAYITIGRNIGQDPLPIQFWGDFKRETALTAQIFGEVVTDAEGRGVYGTIYEDTYILAVSLWQNADEDELGRALDILAGKYHQDSIVLTVGEPQFRTSKVIDGGY